MLLNHGELDYKVPHEFGGFGPTFLSEYEQVSVSIHPQVNTFRADNVPKLCSNAIKKNIEYFVKLEKLGINFVTRKENESKLFSNDLKKEKDSDFGSDED